MIRRALPWLLPVLTGAIFFASWYGVRAATGLSSWILPTPIDIARAAWEERAQLGGAVAHTAVGAVLGFLAAAGAGFVLALLLGLSRWLRACLYPYLLVLQMTPVVVLAPIIQLWFDRGTAAIVTIVFLVSFFPVVVNTTQGLLSVDRNMLDLFRTANATRAQELFLLRVPAAMPFFLAGVRIAAALAPVGAIFGEYLVGSASQGLGYLVYVYNAQIKIPALFATALTSCLLGFIFVAAVSLLNWLALRRWHESIERTDH